MQLESKTVYLLLGSNLGDKEAIINTAVGQIEVEIGEIISRSSLYETAAWGNEDQPSFYNLALGVKTRLSPVAVLDAGLAIERKLGRIRKEKWGARLIDIDLIFFGGDIIDEGDKLQVPHPRMHERRFVLAPLAEICGDLYHPVLKKNVSVLLEELSDQLAVARVE